MATHEETDPIFTDAVKAIAGVFGIPPTEVRGIDIRPHMLSIEYFPESGNRKTTDTKHAGWRWVE